MEECFDFDLDFFSQAQPEAIECSDIDSHELSRRIAETDNLVRTVNSLRAENELLRNQLGDLTKSASEVQLMYQKESIRVGELQGDNQKLSKRIETVELELTSIQNERVQSRFFHSQLEEDWKKNLEDEKERYVRLEADHKALKEKYKKLENDSSRALVDKPSPSKNLNTFTIGAKKRDSNMVSRMVSRGTQYQSSTTTRSTCTSAFIKKQSVGVNFPEVVPLAIEDILMETIMDSHSLLSPINEISESSCTVETQTVSLDARPTISVGTCTQLCNVRNKIDYIREDIGAPNDWTKPNAVLGNVLPVTHTHLSELWELLGQTIFALIGRDSSRMQNFENFNSEMETLRSRFQRYHESCTVTNIPKKEVNKSSCSSPERDNRFLEPPESIRNEFAETDLPDPHDFNSLKNESDPDSSTFQDTSIFYNPVSESNVSLEALEESNDRAIQDESQLSLIKEEMEMLERKLVVISPIRGGVLSRTHLNNSTIKNNVLIHSAQPTGAVSEIPNATEPQKNRKDVNITEKPIRSQTRSELRLEQKRIKRRLKRRNKVKKKKLKEECKIMIRTAYSKFQKESNDNENYEAEDLKLSTNGLPPSEARIHCMKELNFDSGSSYACSNLTRNSFTAMKKDRDDAMTACSQVMQTENCDKFEIDDAKNIPPKSSLNPTVCIDEIVTNENSCHQERLLNLKLMEIPQEDAVVLEPIQSTPNANNLHEPTMSSDEEDFLGFPSDDEEHSAEIITPMLVDNESPQSPEPPDASCSCSPLVVREIPTERKENYDSDCSPASPDSKAPNFSETSKEIVSNHAGCDESWECQSLLGRCIANYKSSNRTAYLKSIRPETPVEGKIKFKLRKIIEKYLVGPADRESCQKYARYLINRSRNKIKLLTSTLCEVVEDTKEELSREFTPPAPLMTPSHQKIFVLVKSLSKYDADIEAKMISALDHLIFDMKPGRRGLNALLNLFHVYLALIDTQTSATNPARLIMYKSLYYYSKLAIPLIYYVIVAYPTVLPKNNDVDYTKTDPLIDTIQSILNSVHYDMEKADLKHREVSHILRMYYEYERGKPSRETVLELLIAKIRSNDFRNVNYAFALLCKRNGTPWSQKHVLTDKLVPLLKEYASDLLETDEHDGKVACILDSISAILKPFPLSCDISSYQKMFFTILYKTERQVVQEAAVLSILRTVRFGYETCFKLLYNWYPSHNVSRTLRLSFETFIYRSSLKKLKILEEQIKGLWN